MLTKEERKITKLDSCKKTLLPEDQQIAQSLLLHYLRYHELTNKQWRLVDRLIQQKPFYSDELSIISEADKRL